MLGGSGLVLFGHANATPVGGEPELRLQVDVPVPCRAVLSKLWPLQAANGGRAARCRLRGRGVGGHMLTGDQPATACISAAIFIDAKLEKVSDTAYGKMIWSL